jgi:L-2-hydroxyglutarate oxidase
MSKVYDVTVIGGGVVGMATAMALTKQADCSLVVLEAEDHLAAHQTGHNSGVIHSGIYYKPGSLKAKNCVQGREAMYRFCEEHDIAHDRCGKVIVALTEAELPQLDNLEMRGKANGLVDIKRLSAAEVKEYEPHAAGLGGIHVPYTGIVDYKQVVATYGTILQNAGGEICTSSRVTKVHPAPDEFVLETAKGEIHTRHIINCGGLQSDRITRMCGVDPNLQIIPFRGEYYEIAPEKEHLVKNLVYPVPDPRFPFLGVHFTRMIHGGIEAGPNAVLAFKREGYEFWDISIRDVVEYGTFGGFWRMVWKFWQTGMGEMYRSLVKAAFVSALKRLLPEIEDKDVHRTGSGVRAQALAPNGALLDDFSIAEADRMIHVLNAPSPAATASISIGETISAMAIKNFGLSAKA